MDELLFSFVMPAYKARFIDEAIKSILEQTYRNLKLIVVDDASPENLASIVKTYDDSRIRYYRNEYNIGGGDLVEQWNHSIRYAKGDYLILASDDDVYFPEYLEKMYSLIRKYPHLGVYRCRIQQINGQGDIIGLDGYLKEYVARNEYIYALMKSYISSGIPYYIFNREKLLQKGGFVNFPMAWHSDNATVMSMAEEGMASSDEILFSFRSSGINITTRRDTPETLQNKLMATRKFLQWADIHILREVQTTTDSRSAFLAGYVKNNLSATCRNALISILYQTNLFVILKSMRIISSTGLFSKKRLLKMCIHPLYLALTGR